MKLDRDKLLHARERLGYGIEMVGEKAGTAKNSVLRAGHEEPIRPSTARKIAHALGVEVADLIKEEESPKAKASPGAGQPEESEEEQRRLAGYVRPWLLLLDSYSERWERAAGEESFSIGAFMEFSASTHDILESVNWVQEHLQRVQKIDPLAGPVGFVFRESLLRMTNTMALVSEAALSIFGNNMLAEARKKRVEIDSARDDLVKRIAT